MTYPIYDSRKGGFTEGGELIYPVYCGSTCDGVAFSLMSVVADPARMQVAYTDLLHMIASGNRFADWSSHKPENYEPIEEVLYRTWTQEQSELAYLKAFHALALDEDNIHPDIVCDFNESYEGVIPEGYK